MSRMTRSVITIEKNPRLMYAPHSSSFLEGKSSLLNSTDIARTGSTRSSARNIHAIQFHGAGKCAGVIMRQPAYP